jgi:hypothetical protein
MPRDWRRKQQQHLIIASEEALDLADDQQVVLGRFKALVSCPFGKTEPNLATLEQLSCGDLRC